MISKIKAWLKSGLCDALPDYPSQGDTVTYLGKAWIVTCRAMPSDAMHRRYMVLEMFSADGHHQRVEVEGRSWHLITKQPIAT